MIYAPMRIFLTGATGYVGGAVLDALVRGGHNVTALVRDNGKARLVAKRGAHPVVGNLADPDSRQVLREQMIEFLFGAQTHMPEGWVPEGQQQGKGGAPAGKGGAPAGKGGGVPATK